MWKTRALAVGLACLVASQVEAATIKKWVDENGVTHYGTTVPPQYVEKGYSELSDQGIELKRRERAQTPEEIRRAEALAELRQEQERLREEQEERDRILLNLYRNEDDLVMARDGKIAQVDGQLRLKHSEIRRLKERLSEHQARAAEAERQGRRLPQRQLDVLDTTQRAIERAYATVLAKEDERRGIIDKYDYDLRRFRTLRQSTPRARNADEILQSEFPELVDTAVHCDTAADCNRLWDLAQTYALAHATTPVDLQADRILVTAPPRELRDISITVSRLSVKQEGVERIFMDVQCANFSEGRVFCGSDAVQAIRNDFRSTLMAASGSRLAR
jgi:hypothetical protein